MGKQKIVEASTANADVASPLSLIGKEGKKKGLSSKPAPKSSEKNASTKNDGDKSSKKGHKSEIDDIFSAGKQKKAQENNEGKRLAGEAVGKEPESAATSKRPRVEGSKDDIFGEASAKGRKRTEEGFPIYSEEELGLGKKGGDTDLCPFDCDCCF